jgi:hypothetical protein
MSKLELELRFFILVEFSVSEFDIDLNFGL